ncbi:MAG: FAD-containing monooxygenase EthA, partial [Mycobacteriales bacterium]
PLLDFQAGYVLRALDRFPKAGDKAPWKLKQNYAVDLIPLRFGRIDDDALHFSTPVRRPVPEKVTAAAS